MKKRAANEQGDALSKLTLAQAATEIGVERRTLKSWRSRFPIFASRGDRVCAQDLYAFRALKALLIEQGNAEEDVHHLVEEAGAQAIINAYGARTARPATNPAHALQHAVRSAAAAGFFGEVYESVDDGETGGAAASSPASYAQARLARLK
jgi:hypothetical protein